MADSEMNLYLLKCMKTIAEDVAELADHGLWYGMRSTADKAFFVCASLNLPPRQNIPDAIAANESTLRCVNKPAAGDAKED